METFVLELLEEPGQRGDGRRMDVPTVTLTIGITASVANGSSARTRSCRARRDVPESWRRLGRQVLEQTAVRQLRQRTVLRRLAQATVARKPNRSTAALYSPLRAPPPRSLHRPSSCDVNAGGCPRGWGRLSTVAFKKEVRELTSQCLLLLVRHLSLARERRDQRCLS
jgi:hypothetical protein